MAILRTAKGRQIRVHAGLQAKQYQNQLHKAGMLDPVLRARGLDRVHLQRVAALLISALRSGEVSTRTKGLASQLGLSHYPDGIERIKE